MRTSRRRRDGSLRSEETVVHGIEHAVDAFLGLLRGANTRKMLVRHPPQTTGRQPDPTRRPPPQRPRLRRPPRSPARTAADAPRPADAPVTASPADPRCCATVDRRKLDWVGPSQGTLADK